MTRRVLIIEDEPNIIEAMSFLLVRDGWQVESHSNGATALDAVQNAAPDAVVLDVMLPNRSGFDILRDIRSDPIYQELPVMMLTARGQKKDRALAMELGATAYMTKPFSNAEVVQAVNQLVSVSD